MRAWARTAAQPGSVAASRSALAPTATRSPCRNRCDALAIRSALSSHAAAGGLIVIPQITPDEPKTAAVAKVLNALGVERRALVVSGEHDAELARATGNIANVRTLPAAQLNVVDLIDAHHLVMTEDAVRRAEGLWGGDQLKPARGRKREAS